MLLNWAQSYTFFWIYASFCVILHDFIGKMVHLVDYIEAHSSAESAALEQITRDTYRHVLNPHMLSGHVQGRVLSMLSKMIRPTRILELGTYTGYSALCLAEGLTEEGHLISVERNDELEDRIIHNLSLSELGHKIEVRFGAAEQIIPALDGQFDLVFIDADKRDYCTYLDLVYSRVREGGWILADNTLWDGHIIDAAYDKDAQTLGLRAFNDRVANDPRLEKVILPLRDGLTIIHKL